MVNHQLPTQFRLRRLAQGLRLRDLQNLAGIPESTLSRIERGEQIPTFRQLERLGNALGIDAEQALRELRSPTIECREPAPVPDREA